MTNNATKFVLGLAVAGIVAAIAPGFVHMTAHEAGVIDDKASVLLFVGVFLAGSAVAFGLGRSVGADLPPSVEPGAATPVDPADAPRPSYGPLLLGIGATTLGCGGALGPRYFIVGIAIAVIAATVWIFDAMRPHVDPVDATNVDHRFLAPLAMPVGAFLLAITIAISLSRVLLAVSEVASWVIALIVAAVVLLVLTMIANRVPATKVVVGLAGVGMLGVLVAGGAGAGIGERDFEHHENETPQVEITAQNIAYDRNIIAFPADTDVELIFNNLDTGTFHNVAIYDEANAPVFNGKPIAHGTQDYTFKTPAPGTYRYVCDFHPAMTGELRVAQEGSKE
jgi:plastocyanin